MRYERIEINIFDRHFERSIPVLTAAARGAADVFPVGRFIAGPGEPALLHKRFEKVHRMAVFGFPVGPDSSDDAAQHMGGQMRDAHPGEDQKPGIVRDPQKVSAAGLRAPADELIPGPGFPGSGAEKDAGKIAAVAVAHKILHVLSDGTVEAQIVMAGEVMMKPPFLVRTVGRDNERQGEQIYKRGLNGRGGRRCRSYGCCRRSESIFALIKCTNGRERNQTALHEFAKKSPSGKVL